MYIVHKTRILVDIVLVVGLGKGKKGIADLNLIRDVIFIGGLPQRLI